MINKEKNRLLRQSVLTEFNAGSATNQLCGLHLTKPLCTLISPCVKEGYS